jgi:hypothetical protein
MSEAYKRAAPRAAKKAPAKKAAPRKAAAKKAVPAKKAPAKKASPRRQRRAPEPRPPLVDNRLYKASMDHALRGHSWAKIADTYDWASAAEAATAVTAWLRETDVGEDNKQRADALAAMHSRLDALLDKSYEKGIVGDSEVWAGIYLRTAEAKAKLDRLYDATEAVVERTIVVAGDEASYVATLQREYYERHPEAAQIEGVIDAEVVEP